MTTRNIRTRSYEWLEPTGLADRTRSLSGQEYLKAWSNGEMVPPIAATLGFYSSRLRGRICRDQLDAGRVSLQSLWDGARRVSSDPTGYSDRLRRPIDTACRNGIRNAESRNQLHTTDENHHWHGSLYRKDHLGWETCRGIRGRHCCRLGTGNGTCCSNLHSHQPRLTFRRETRPFARSRER